MSPADTSRSPWLCFLVEAKSKEWMKEESERFIKLCLVKLGPKASSFHLRLFQSLKLHATTRLPFCSYKTACFCQLPLSTFHRPPTFSEFSQHTLPSPKIKMPPKKANAKAKATPAKMAAAAAAEPPATVTTAKGKKYETTAAAGRPRRATTTVDTSPIKQAPAKKAATAKAPAKKASSEQTCPTA